MYAANGMCQPATSDPATSGTLASARLGKRLDHPNFEIKGKALAC